MYLISCETVVTATHEDDITIDRIVAFPEGVGQIGNIETLLMIQDFPVMQINTLVIHKMNSIDASKFTLKDRVLQ
jgi:Ser-tRNA(Ala) deacylase AlaX